MSAERLARVRERVMAAIAGPRPSRVPRLTPPPRRDLLTDAERLDLRRAFRFVLQKALREHDVRTDLHVAVEASVLARDSDPDIRQALDARRDELQRHLQAAGCLTDVTIDEFLDDVLTHAAMLAAKER